MGVDGKWEPCWNFSKISGNKGLYQFYFRNSGRFYQKKSLKTNSIHNMQILDSYTEKHMWFGPGVNKPVWDWMQTFGSISQGQIAKKSSLKIYNEMIIFLFLRHYSVIMWRVLFWSYTPIIFYSLSKIGYSTYGSKSETVVYYLK